MADTRYIFDTSVAARYRFPTHTNLLIMDRSESALSEAFWVVIQANEAPPVHVHSDVEQLFYVAEGTGELRIGPDGTKVEEIKPGDLVRIPSGTLHSVKASGDGRLVYLGIDCFVAGRPATEPTWDSHVRAFCAQNGWSFEKVRTGDVGGPTEEV